MRHTITTLALLIFSFAAFAQTDSPEADQKKQLPNRAIIQTISGKKVKGWFYKMDNDKIYLLPSSNKSLKPSFLSSAELNDGLIPMDVSQIRTIGLQKKGAAGKGALLGLGIGALTGVITGFASGDDPIQPYSGDPFADIFIALGNSFAMTAEEKALANGVLMGTTGAITGFLIGKLTKKKFILNGSKQVYRDLDGEMRKRLLIQ